MSSPSVFAPPAQAQLAGRPPGRKAWVRFGVQRLSLLIVFPLAATLATWVRPESTWWMAVGAGVVSHGIGWFTTALHLSSRFRGVQEDDRPILLMSGEWLDRADFRRWMRAFNIERFIATGTVSMLVLAMTWPDSTRLVLGLLLLLFIAWSLQTIAIASRFREAVIAFASDDHQATIDHLAPVLHNPLTWPHWRERDAARLWIAQAQMRLGRLIEAEELLHRVRLSANRAIAQRLIAQIRLAHGQPAYAHALAEQAPPKWPSARLHHELMKGLLDLYTKRFDALRARSEGWASLLDQVPPRRGAPLRFLQIAALVGLGDLDQAAALCAKESIPWSHYPWLAQCWPEWDGLMARLPETR